MGVARGEQLPASLMPFRHHLQVRRDEVAVADVLNLIHDAEGVRIEVSEQVNPVLLDSL